MPLFKRLTPYVFGFYILLFLFTTFTLLYEFVIPHGGFLVEDPVLTTTMTTTSDTTSPEGTTTSEVTTTTTGVVYPGDVPSLLQTARVIGTHLTDSLLITIYQVRVENSDVYVADVVVTDAHRVLTALAFNTFGGKNIVQPVSTMAEAHDAIFAINSDYASHYTGGLVIRNGVILRTSYSDRNAVALMNDGNLVTFREKDTSAEAMLEAGAWQLWSFGPVLVKNGVAVSSVNDGLDRDAVNNPRSAIGMVSANHFMFVCVDGRNGSSAGVDIEELASIMLLLGCEQAYNFDGGGSATMWFDGVVVNHPSDGSERAVGDCVYIVG